MCFVRDLIDVISMISVKFHLNCFELLIDLSVAFVIFENCQKNIYIYKAGRLDPPSSISTDQDNFI